MLQFLLLFKKSTLSEITQQLKNQTKPKRPKSVTHTHSKTVHDGITFWTYHPT